MKTKTKIKRGLRRVTRRTEITALRKDVSELQVAVEESRRLNERLSDVLDVMTELLVPAVDRNEERLAVALRKL